ncbi:class F sortase [Saccharopolyspora aridisoli]|uniref:Class F sortase n=1 Tax=Saccharopolyspora aridisoli TaxID=2530385 RepID=A0A4R4UJB3_9PSEU|nr:class F sortase [Saccharopolyspora aridisoli]TDC91821.1 class F sortase [Saccharopolyspora aridisoli]
MNRLRAVLLAALIGSLTSCGGAAINGPTAPPTPITREGVALPASNPVELHIPAIEATSTLVPLGLNADDTVEVPPVETPMQAGWYRFGPTPGQLGPAVILGHVDGGGHDGIFARLHEVEPEDEVIVTRRDGRTATFTVTRVAQVPKTEFPVQEVYGNSNAAELRLITCGGSFDPERDSYRDNIIAYAALTAGA